VLCELKFLLHIPKYFKIRNIITYLFLFKDKERERARERERGAETTESRESRRSRNWAYLLISNSCNRKYKQ
jgi:hypothetical protein